MELGIQNNAGPLGHGGGGNAAHGAGGNAAHAGGWGDEGNGVEGAVNGGGWSDDGYGGWDDHIGDVGAASPGHGGGGGGVAEYPVSRAVASRLRESLTPKARRGERVLPTKVVVLAFSITHTKDCLEELRSSQFREVLQLEPVETQVGALGTRVVAGTPATVVRSVEGGGTDVSGITAMVVYRADEFRKVLASKGSSAHRRLVAQLSVLGLLMPRAYRITFLWPPRR